MLQFLSQQRYAYLRQSRKFYSIHGRESLKVDQEKPREINEYHNGTTTHETIGNAINQDENYIYRPRRNPKN